MSGVERQPPGRDGSTSEFDPKRGAIFGAGAWAFGVVLTAVLSWIEFRQTASALENLGTTGQASELQSILPSPVDVVGFMFYNAHFVDVGFDFGIVGMWINLVHGNVDVTGLAATQATGTDLTAVADLERALDLLVGTVPTVAWLLVPVVSLAWGGYMVASRNDVTGSKEGAKAGASVAVGYAVLSVAGTFLFAWRLAPSGEMVEVTIRPELTMAAGLMGMVYPAVFGGIGGWVAARTGADQSNRGDPRPAGPGPAGGGGYRRPPAGRDDGRQPEEPHPPQGGPQSRAGNGKAAPASGHGGEQPSGGGDRRAPSREGGDHGAASRDVGDRAGESDDRMDESDDQVDEQEGQSDGPAGDGRVP